MPSLRAAKLVYQLIIRVQYDCHVIFVISRMGCPSMFNIATDSKLKLKVRLAILSSGRAPMVSEKGRKEKDPPTSPPPTTHNRKMNKGLKTVFSTD